MLLSFDFTTAERFENQFNFLRRLQKLNLRQIGKQCKDFKNGIKRIG